MTTLRTSFVRLVTPPIAVGVLTAAIGIAGSRAAAAPTSIKAEKKAGTMSQPSPSVRPPAKSAHVDVNGVSYYYEVRGTGDVPLVLLHGGLHNTQLDAPVAARLAEHRRVISIDLQGHGRTADVDRPLRFETLADDVAALLKKIGVERADLVGYSLGGSVALRTAIQHAEGVRKLVLLSIPFASSGWYPEVQEGFKHLGHALAEMMRPAPVYQTYAAIAPHPEKFPTLLDKVGELETRSYDWSAEVAKLATPTMLVYADADSVPTSHVARFFELLGGGKRDGGLDGSGAPKGRLAILPGHTHYNIFESPDFVAAIEPFLDAR
jgi:pimeloyl-ACP methyl ester carboxylesterase